MSETKKMEWPKLKFFDGFDEKDIDYALDKGYAHALVELEDGRKYELEFSDVDSIPWSMGNVVKNIGFHHIAIPNLIILTDVTIENMYEAVRTLAKEKFGFFAHLKEWNIDDHKKFWGELPEYKYLAATQNSEYVKSELRRCGWDVRRKPQEDDDTKRR